MSASALNVFVGLKANDPLSSRESADFASGLSSFREDESRKGNRNRAVPSTIGFHSIDMTDSEYMEQKWLINKKSVESHGKIDQLRRSCGNKYEMTRQIAEMWEEFEEDAYLAAVDGTPDYVPAWIKSTQLLAPDTHAYKEEMKGVNAALSEEFLEFVEEQLAEDIARIEEDDTADNYMLREPDLRRNLILEQGLDQFRRVDLDYEGINILQEDMAKDDMDDTEVIANWGEGKLGQAEGEDRDPRTEGPGVLPLLTGWEPCQSLTLEDLFYEDHPDVPGHRRLILPGIEDEDDYSEIKELEKENVRGSAMEELLSQTDDDEEVVKVSSGQMDSEALIEADQDVYIDDDLVESEPEPDDVTDDAVNNMNDMWG